MKKWKTFKKWRLLFILILSLPVFLISQTTQTFTTSGSFVVPAGVTSIFVEAWGAGGSGGGALGQSTNGGKRAIGGGGGGGAYVSGTISVTPGSTINYIVAPATSAATTVAIDGSPSTFSTVSAVGGTGGQCVSTVAAGNNHIGGTGGAGGTGTYDGGAGGSRVGYAGENPGSYTGPAGGGGAGTLANGGDASNVISNNTAGAGGTNDGGNGATGITNSQGSGRNGTAGVAPGGGGGGAWAAASSTQRSGGTGARGQIRITYSVILPVEMTSFFGSPTNKTNQLYWQTASETNNSHFSIEKSTDGKTFREIGKVAGNGTSTKVNDYSFSDESPANGINYYRLKQVDFDGNFEYSKIISLVFGKQQSQVQLYPTIASDEIQIRFSSVNEIAGMAQIFNQNGQLVHVLNFEDETSEIPISIGELQSGIYFIKIQNGKVVETLRFVKQ